MGCTASVWDEPPERVRLKHGEVHLWLALWDGSKPIPEATHWFSQEELLRARRFHFIEDRRRFIFGRVFLRTVLAAYLAPTGGLTPIFGNNPLGVGIPAGSHHPIVLDIAMSVAPRGKIGLQLAEGRPLQPGAGSSTVSAVLRRTLPIWRPVWACPSEATKVMDSPWSWRLWREF